jgi:hypothetical protein
MTYRYSGESYIRRKNNESQLQMMIARWLDVRDIFYTASLGGVNLGPVVGALRKRLGCKAGVPDIIMFKPRGKYCGMTLEVKIKGGTVTPEQREFQYKARERNYHSVIMPTNLDFNAAYDWAIRELEAYLNLKEV